jgi:hypothetical protein
MEPKCYCKICEKEANAHSFSLVEITTNDLYIFYACPGKATKCDDVDGIRNHYQDTINYYKPVKSKWRWVFDATGFDITHLMRISSANAVCDVINQNSDTLEQILVINPTWFLRKALEILVYSQMIYPNVVSKIVFRD